MSAPHAIVVFYTTLSYLSRYYPPISYNYGTGGDVMKPLKEKISITIDCDILSRAKEEAENQDRSLSQFINIILKEHFKKTDGKKNK